MIELSIKGETIDEFAQSVRGLAALFGGAVEVTKDAPVTIKVDVSTDSEESNAAPIVQVPTNPYAPTDESGPVLAAAEPAKRTRRTKEQIAADEKAATEKTLAAAAALNPKDPANEPATAAEAETMQAIPAVEGGATIEHCRAAMRAVSEKFSFEDTRILLGKFSLVKISEIKPDQCDAFVAMAKAWPAGKAA